jgi:hypothetical protein
MPSLRYAGNELRRRSARTVLTALGLAAGVALVMGIVGVSDGLDSAQRKVLSPLGSVGTDILVTRTVAPARRPAPARRRRRARPPVGEAAASSPTGRPAASAAGREVRQQR